MVEQTRKLLTALQREVLIGILLGDANLQTENQGKTYRLRVSQSEKHKLYVFHLYQIFKELTDSEPIEYSFSDSRNPGKVSKRWSFSTVQLSSLRFYGQQFYGPNGKKLPRLIHRWLMPRSIAYWYMDDGAQKWKGRSLAVRFCTDNFTRSEVQTLSKLLERSYSLKTSIQKQRNQFRIYVSSDSFFQLKTLIYPYLHPSMLFKFPEGDHSLPV
uniref:Homing endonuclease LAGLIDADG domain-containing protein n=1 Tax=Sarcinofilum mucosum TaxID=141643 RepID=Q9BBN5_SARMC|nr:unknown [Sarcinofilum mucosum]